MPTTCSPNPKPNQSNPIICNNSKIDMSFLVQMTQSNKMWKCKEWWNIQLTLRIWCRPSASPASCKTLGNIYWFHPPNQEKAKNPEMRSNSQQTCCTVMAYIHRKEEVELEACCCFIFSIFSCSSVPYVTAYL